MPVFTNPVTFDTDKIFSFVGQEFDKKSSIGVYVEDAAAIAAQSFIKIKHDPTKTPRHLLQRTVKRVPTSFPEMGVKPITINFTITADVNFTAAEVAEEVAILLDAASTADLVKNLLTNKL